MIKILKYIKEVSKVCEKLTIFNMIKNWKTLKQIRNKLIWMKIITIKIY
jgi:hypothetical protein